MNRYHAWMSEEDPLSTVPTDLLPLIPGFVERRKEDTTNLRTLLLKSDYASISHIGHNLRGLGLGYGFKAITELGAELEEAAAQKNRTKIVEVIKNLSILLGQ
jgi:hypothetical protein